MVGNNITILNIPMPYRTNRCAGRTRNWSHKYYVSLRAQLKKEKYVLGRTRKYLCRTSESLVAHVNVQIAHALCVATRTAHKKRKKKCINQSKINKKA